MDKPDRSKRSRGKFFAAPEKKGPSRSEEFEAHTLEVEVRSRARTQALPDPVPAANETRRTTTAFIKDAVRQKRFVSIATKLADKGQSMDAGRLGQKAMKEGKFEQAIRIYEKLNDHQKLAEANYLAARDCQRKGGSAKIVISRLYAAVQSCGRLLASGTKDDKLRIMRRLTVISDDLSKALDNTGDLFGAADCYLFRAVTFQNLVPYCRDGDYFSKDPEFFASVGRKVKVNAQLARERYKRFIDDNDIAPDSAQGKVLIGKLSKVNKLLSIKDETVVNSR